jgi:copper transport protein
MHPARWLAALAAAWAGGAAGHAGLAASIPADGATLATAPSSIELRFTEPVTPVAVRLIAASGTPVALAAPPVQADAIKLALPADLREGLYTVSFRVISADSHPIGGSIVFAVGERAPPPRAAGGSASSPSVGTTLARAVRDLALLVAAGAALFALAIARFPAERRVLGIAGVAAALAAVGCIGVHGAAMMDVAVTSLEAWRGGLHSSFGLSACLAAVGALFIAAGAFAGGAARVSLLLAGALAVIASLPLTGHAMTARPAAVAVMALAVHGLTAAFWVGSLVALFAIMSTRTAGDAAVLHRFSRWAMIAVALLVLAGITFVVLQLGSVSELFGSDYGWLIVGKVFFLGLLLVLAFFNRFRWLPMLERGVRAAAARLRWSIAGEVALAACVIGVTAVLVQTPPPRAAAAERGFTQKLAHKDDFAVVTVNPARAGANAIVVRFQDKEGLPFDPEEVLVEIGNQAAGVEAASRPIRRLGPGHYGREGSELAFPGVWTIEVHARMDASSIATFRSQVPIR